MSDNSQTLNWTTSQTAAVTVTPSPTIFANEIVIANESTQILFVRADGTTAVVDAAGTVEIPVGAEVTIQNGLGLPNSNLSGGHTSYQSGPSGLPDQSESAGWTAQQAYTSGTPTTLSVIPAAGATGTVNVTFQ